MLAKATIALLEADPSGADVFRAGLDFGVARRGEGWFRGLTTLTCFMNLVPRLDGAERAAALYHGLADVASDSATGPPRFPLDAAPGRRARARAARVAGSAASSRCATPRARSARSSRPSAAGASPSELADMLFAAATDHRYLDGGHTLDFVNKALEALDVAGWERAEAVLASLPAQLAFAERMEEANAWRNPVDLVALLERAFEGLPGAVADGAARRGGWDGRDELVTTMLDGEAAADPRRAARGAPRGRERGRARLCRRVRGRHADRALPDEQRVRRLGHRAAHVHVRERRRAGPAPLAVARAPARRLRRRRERPPRPLPERAGHPAADARSPAPTRTRCSTELPALLDRQQQVDEAGQLVASFLGAGGDAGAARRRARRARSSARTATSTRSSASRPRPASTSCSRHRRARCR